MASRSAAERWLEELTNLPTASGHEDAVISWARAWARRRADLSVRADSGGNLLIIQKGRRRDPVLAVAHMDHPAFVVDLVSGREASFSFRGGVRPEYFPEARVQFVTGAGGGGRVSSHDPKTGTGTILLDRRAAQAAPGDVARWKMAERRPAAGMFHGPACDDLAGCAAALAALDRARGNPEMRHFGVLLTRAEEIGFIGAIHAAKSGLIPAGSRLLSIEASRASSEAPIGGGPVVRVGDASTVFDRDLVNLISRAASSSGLTHQRKLMAGGSCEATAFGAYGYQAAGLCLPLGNYHNMGDLDAVERGTGTAVPRMELIALSDFHGLVDLLLIACAAVDGEDVLKTRLDDLYEGSRHLLG